MKGGLLGRTRACARDRTREGTREGLGIKNMYVLLAASGPARNGHASSGLRWDADFARGGRRGHGKLILDMLLDIGDRDH